jgi:predicted short-subunit dehydrogenase-like oxidoreductase (DUF2520 family)
MNLKVALVGPGRVGCAVSKRLNEAGYPVTTIISRSHERATEACSYIGCSTTSASTQLTELVTAEIILLTVPDDQIRPLAVRIQTLNQFTKPPTLIHFSGLHPARVMQHHSSPLELLSLHPLLPFASREKAYLNLQGCPCALESKSPKALMIGEELVSAIRGAPFTIDQNKKPLYHAAACIASNYLVSLFASARELLINCGIEPDRATPLLLPLVRASVGNIQNLGPEQGLTGPIVRGDIGTVTEHLQAIQDNAPELLQLYLQMGIVTVEISQKSGRLAPQTATLMKDLLDKKGLK